MNTNLPVLVSTFHDLEQKYGELVLATIIETMGSTYRKAGARMLITPDGEFFGLLGDGYLEADLIAHAAEVFGNKKTKIVLLGMRAPEDEAGEPGPGYNGTFRILLQLISTDTHEHPVSLIEDVLLKKQKQVLLTVCESEHDDFMSGECYLFQHAADSASGIPGYLPENIIQITKKTAVSGSSFFARARVDNLAVSFFSCEIKPPFHLLIIGAGPDAVPVTRFGRELGWEITIVDYRESFLDQEGFHDIPDKVLVTPEELQERVDLSRPNAIVLMTHKIDYDERYLEQITKTSAVYIGLPGPAAHRDRLLESLGEGQALIHDRVFGPVGLDIGGELPEEIALSLVAEIQATLYQRDGGSLNAKSELLRQQQGSDKKDLYAVILAAGSASRFGGLKQLLEYEGTSLLRRSVEFANRIVEERVKVVLGARAQKVKRELERLDTGIVLNNEWESGMASSIQAGVEAIPDDCSAILLILCDQPLVTAEQLEQLCNSWLKDSEKIVVSAYAGTLGAPVIIPRKFFPQIMKLKGDSGAKTVIEKNKTELIIVNIPEAEFDIDTEADYMSLLSGQAIE